MTHTKKVLEDIGGQLNLIQKELATIEVVPADKPKQNKLRGEIIEIVQNIYDYRVKELGEERGRK